MSSLRFWCTAVLLAVSLAAFVLPTHGQVGTAAERQAAQQDPAYQQLLEAANAVVGVKVKALPNARSNESLGVERMGSGIVINDEGLVLTISYLILEADQVEVTDSQGKTVPAAVIAYDHSTGFGLVRPLKKLSPNPIRIGDSSPVSTLDRLLVVSGGPEQAVSIATVVSTRRFAGYWEYLIDGAIFTSPPRLDHSGAALINETGELVGVGSLFVMDALKPGERLPGNMFVPVNLLKPVLDEMIRTGSSREARRAWLGVNSLEQDGRVKVIQVNDESPAAKAGIEAGDIILRINGEAIENLEDFYRRLWRYSPGTEVRLTVLHGVETRDLAVQSIDRKEFMRKKPTI